MPLIVVVDDDSNLREAIRRMLEPAGFEVVEAEDGRAAVQAFRARPADLVLCDLFMPEKCGLEVLQELPGEYNNVKIVAMSGGGFGGTMDMLPAARDFGATAVIYKPFEKAELLSVVRQVLAPLTA